MYIVNYCHFFFLFQTTETCTEPESISISSGETEEKEEVTKPEFLENKEKINEEASQDEAEKNSVIDGDGADEIMSVLQVNIGYIFNINNLFL